MIKFITHFFIANILEMDSIIADQFFINYVK